MASVTAVSNGSSVAHSDPASYATKTDPVTWTSYITVFFLIFYLSVLLYGALGSTSYSLGYWGTEPLSYFAGLITGTEEIGRLERSSTAWRPYIWPIKTIMVVGLLLMLMQAVSELIKDVALLLNYTKSEQTT